MTEAPEPRPPSALEAQETRSLKVFLASAMLAVVLCISGAFLGMAVRNRQLIQDEMVHRLRRDFQNIVVMRQWNAQHGGVYVEKKAGTVSNPYLANPDITTLDGRVLTKKNPALMTRELSELMDPSQGYTLHITSLRPLNPDNGPDPREAEALRAFERGLKEQSWMEHREQGARFRYMAPLLVEPSCLGCHGKQGYRIGEVRGGISISLRVNELQAKLRHSLYLVAGLAALTILLILGSVTLLFRQLVLRLQEARRELKALAVTDALTGIQNRRATLLRLEEELERHRRSGAPVCCTLLDLDHFKQVNDQLGHLAGDQVLRDAAGLLRSASRTYDMVGRYGGEEFILVLPGTTLEEARDAVERVRKGLEAQLLLTDGRKVTASFGLTQWRPGESAAELLARADEAMYQAKAKGRNRVEVKA
ncbi:MAG: diguanylate cyclase protein [Holophagaceae bacterium]|nr:diguanylate cyclase protein [Holophagaceae bacterium]